MTDATKTRISTTLRTKGLEIPEAFAQATVSAAANGKGTKADRRRLENKARRLNKWHDEPFELDPDYRDDVEWIRRGR